MKLADIREKYPMYNDVPDDQLARAFHQKFYSDLDFKDFSRKIGYLKGADPSEYDSASPEFREKYGAQSGSTLENLRAGIGKGMTDMLRGIGQATGMVSREDVADARSRDQDLMATGAGKAGNIAGTITAALPAAFIPGANTYAGAAAIGAGLGALQPSTSTRETLTNTAIGGALSPAALLAGRGVVGVAKGAKAALWDPLTKGGQQRIAERTLQSFAGGADEAARAAQNIRSGMQNTLPGVQPTTAELAQNAGLSQLERVLKNNPDAIQAFSNRAMGNRNAMLSAVDSIAGDDAARAAAVAARDTASRPLYAAADDALATTDDALQKILSRPSAAKAVEHASRIAAESGEEFSTDILSGKNLHTLKMAMDDLADWSPSSGIGKNEARAIGNTRDQLLAWIDKNIPDYAAARGAFREWSRPINQMDIGAALRDKLTPALTDFGAQTRLRPESFAQAMRNGDATAANVLGRSQASMADILSPDQMRSLTQVGEQLARRVNADELGKAVGSNTGQNLVGQNVLRQMLGPLGLPESAISRAAQGPLLQGILGAPSKIGQAATGTIGEPNILKKLVEIGLTPEEALRVLEAQIASGQGAISAGRYIAPAVSGANASRQ